MTKALLVRTNGKISEVKIENLSDMQAGVGGYIEALPIDENKHGMSIYINEEGRLEELPINMTMSIFLVREDASPGMEVPVHGDVRICGPTGEEGERTDVGEDVLSRLPRFWVEPSFEIMSFDPR